MSVTPDRTRRATIRWVRPLHAFLLAGTVPLFLGAAASDLAYAQSYQIQWTNFASWLITGGLIFAGLALLCAVIDLVRAERREGRMLFYTLVLLATWVLGLVNALIHAKDAWASMPAGLVLSILVAFLVIALTWLGFLGLQAGGER